jgi:hypothetical protein
MSKDCSGFPGIWIAVTHFVWPVFGAPGPWQPAAAAGDAVSDAAPITATEPDKQASNFPMF